MVHRSAASSPLAMEGARAAGHDPILCLPFGMTRAAETKVIAAWRHGMTTCAACGYSLAGLPRNGYLVCPECGVGSAPPQIEGRLRAGAPHCAHCGYCLSGIAVGETDLRCPECGSTNPFVERK
jgi:predicted RNA-binding Zn-ribbon protein involved in translation (DUF1610 family)